MGLGIILGYIIQNLVAGTLGLDDYSETMWGPRVINCCCCCCLVPENPSVKDLELAATLRGGDHVQAPLLTGGVTDPSP